MNYTDVALTAEQVAALKKSWRKTGWRLKVLKPSGKKLPDNDNEKAVRIDSDYPGSYYPLDTEGGRYMKLIHDPDRNRTFVLHYEDMNETDRVVVSIINHFLGTDHEDYIEKINAATSAGWPTTTRYGHPAYDMAFDPATQRLAVTAPGWTNPWPQPGLGPALFVIDCRRTLPELMSNVCNRLKPNPDYLSCTIWDMGSTIAGSGDSYVRFVRFHGGRWWTWTRVATSSSGVYYQFWQLGYFNQSGNYTHVFQYGYTPRDGDTKNKSSEFFAKSVCFPNYPRWYPIGSDASPAEPPSGYWGDPVAGLCNVTSFNVQNGGEQGYLIIGTTPAFSGLAISQFGIEACVYVIDIAKMLKERIAPKPIVQLTISREATYNPGTGFWGVPSGTLSQVVSFDDAIGPVLPTRVGVNRGIIYTPLLV